MKNNIMASVREYIRTPYAWPGGYQKILIMSDGEVICPDCARSEYRQISNSTRHKLRDGWSAEGVDIFYEGASINCAHCNKQIDSAYGDPSVEETN